MVHAASKAPARLIMAGGDSPFTICLPMHSFNKFQEVWRFSHSTWVPRDGQCVSSPNNRHAPVVLPCTATIFSTQRCILHSMLFLNDEQVFTADRVTCMLRFTNSAAAAAAHLNHGIVGRTMRSIS